MAGVKGQNRCGCTLLMMDRMAVFKNPRCFCSVLPRDNLTIMAANKSRERGGVIILFGLFFWTASSLLGSWGGAGGGQVLAQST